MSMFDVSDLNNPVEIFNVDIGENNVSSEMSYNHKALFYNKEKNLIGFGIRDYLSTSSYKATSKFLIYKIDLEKIIGKQFKESKDMPILEDLYNVFEEDEKTKKYAIKLIPFVKGSMKFLNNYTNIELNNDLIIADIYDLGEDNLKYGMYLFTDIFWDKIKENREEKKAIYLDEIWRLIRSYFK